MTLVVMAAGMGSRFGGLKQIEPVGPNGEFIIDYSIYDAICAGFSKVVFIIKKENYEIFKETIGSRVEGKIEVEYVFQDNEKVPGEISVPETRVKPLGTGHALYCASPAIQEPFAVISADDFYGREPFFLLHESLQKGETSVIGYLIGNTLTENGSVKRGVCSTKDGKLEKLVESKVERRDGKIIGEPLNGEPSYEMDEDQPVSMLMYGIQPSILPFLEKDMAAFLRDNQSDLSTCEYLLPDALNHYADEEKIDMMLLPTTAVWKGVTYASDLEELKGYIRKLIDEGVYPSHLEQVRKCL